MEIKCIRRWNRFLCVFVGGLAFCTNIVGAKLNEPEGNDRRLQRFKGSSFSRYPLDQCQGDCDVDAHCRGNLVCFQRNGSESVPGCIGGENDRTPTDYCTDPKYIASYNTPQLPTLNFLGRNPSPSNYPLQECEGDCDIDSDCAAGLVCFQRTPENSGSVPGCAGTDNSAADYCVKSSFSNQNSQPSPPAPAATTRNKATTIENFGLKMYWESHYFWQEENFDRRWCMECWDGQCDYGDKTYIHTCDHAYSQKYDFISVNDKDFMIRLHGTLLCFERISRDIFLYDCDFTNHRQFWVADFQQEKFEIKPFGLGTHCVTQRHHPKFYEEVEIEPCHVARSSHTSYWTKF